MAYAPGEAPVIRTRKKRMHRPVNQEEGPWLIWSHYHGAWHRPGACGYTIDLLSAGIFDYAMAEAYHDLNNYPVRDEAIPLSKFRSQYNALLKFHYGKMQEAIETIQRMDKTNDLSD